MLISSDMIAAAAVAFDSSSSPVRLAVTSSKVSRLQNLLVMGWLNGPFRSSASLRRGTASSSQAPTPQVVETEVRKSELGESSS